MKLLVVCSSLDLRVPLSSTPSWWQLLKALAEAGIDLVVAPYQGPPIESPWWTSAANPCQREGDLVGWLKQWARPRTTPSSVAGETASDRVTRTLVDRFTRPRWRAHLARLLERHRDIDAVLFVSVPPNHFVGVPRYLRRRFGVPTYLYDGDVPASLPSFAGFRTGFKIYPGADLSEYEGVLSNSLGGLPELERLGARRTGVLYYAADPVLFSPLDVEPDLDIFFYGHGQEYREQWVEAMLTSPSQAMPGARFAVRGTRLASLGRTEYLPYLSFNRIKEYCCRSRINLLITRQAHASVYGSSTARPFELAALGAAMVSNPYTGVEVWFEPGREIVIVRDAQDAIDTYTRLLRDPSTRRELGFRARERLLAEHTYAHRADELVRFVSSSSATSGSAAHPRPTADALPVNH